MAALLDGERHLMHYINLPFGTRVVCWALKPALVAETVTVPAWERQWARIRWPKAAGETVESIRGCPSQYFPQHRHDAGDDQVGALGAHAPLWPDRRGAGGARHSQPAYLIWIIVALVAARSAAMAFNRLVDADIDAENPRTKIRALPAGKLSKQFVLGFVIVTSAILMFAAWQLNPLSFYLSPVALAIVFFYSFTKRFTRWAHVVLGLGDGHRSGSRMDRGARLVRSAHSAADRRGGVLGRRLRHPL